MSNYFINYDADTDHLSIRAFRNTGYANSDVLDLVAGIHAGRSGNCPLDGAKDALEGGSIWMDELIINQLHELIQEHEALSALRGCIMETLGPDAHSALVLADAALAAHRKGGE